MNIFFKLLAVGGLGGAVVGAVYLSKQEYTNNHVTSGDSSTTKEPAKDVDVKRQPETSLNPKSSQPQSSQTSTSSAQSAQQSDSAK